MRSEDVHRERVERFVVVDKMKKFLKLPQASSIFIRLKIVILDKRFKMINSLKCEFVSSIVNMGLQEKKKPTKIHRIISIKI